MNVNDVCSLDNLHTRYTVSKKSVQKLKGTVRARLKTLKQVALQTKNQNQEIGPDLQTLRDQVKNRRE